MQKLECGDIDVLSYYKRSKCKYIAIQRHLYLRYVFSL